MQYYKYGNKQGFYISIAPGSVVKRYDLIDKEWKEGPYPLPPSKIEKNGNFKKVKNPFSKTKNEEDK